MAIPFYSLFAILSILILSLYYVQTIKIKVSEDESITSFRVLILWNILFALQDGIWGLCDVKIIQSSKIFFLSSMFFHISTVVTTNIWLRYVLTVTGEAVKRKHFLKGIGYFLVAFQGSLLIVNIFHPVIFYISDEGKYVASFLRPIAFYNQYFLYVIAAIVAICKILKGNKEYYSEHFSVLMFVAAPLSFGILQLKFPQAPYYTIGYLLGCVVIYCFMISGHEILFLKEFINKQKDQYKKYYELSQKEITRNAEILYSMAEGYYSMHLIDLAENTVTQYSARDEVKQIVNKETDADILMFQVISATVIDGYRDAALNFTNLTNLAERMKGKKYIDAQFIGIRIGWFIATFITIEADNEGKPTKVIFTTRSIDEEKKKEQHLIYKSNTDELTGFYNRRAYETAITNYGITGLENNFVYFSLDVNGLKNVNDSIGHAAGDELLIGACECMKECFEPYGRLFRTGGDEFVALISANEIQLQMITNKLEALTASWKGNLVDSLSISYGYVLKDEAYDLSIQDIGILADKRMYESKAKFYRKNGFDRRGQRDAHIVLCASYAKILKVNLTDNSYQIVNMNITEQTKEKGFSEKISEWLTDFGKSGQVHPDDLFDYLRQTNRDYLREYFKSNKKSLIIFYRRKIEDSYKKVMMEIIPTNEYSETSETVFLYVKDINN